MHRTFYIIVLIFAFISCSFLFLNYQIVFSQSYSGQNEKEVNAERDRKKFIKELQALLDAAKKSGFSEKQIREVSVTRDGKLVNVWDFLELVKLKQKKEALAKKRTKTIDRYLTVIEIGEEIESGETSDLDAIKDKSTFVGAEEK